MALAYFSTWTTFGTWLPGDMRGWFLRHKGLQPPDFQRELHAALRMSEDAVVLNDEQRLLVEKTISDHCRIRGWTLHAVNCRTNHVHVVVTAGEIAIETPREQFKSWCTRRLNERERQSPSAKQVISRHDWWTERGWDIFLDDEESLEGAVLYVVDGQ